MDNVSRRERERGKGRVHNSRRSCRVLAAGLRLTGSSMIMADCKLVALGRPVQAKLNARIGLVRDAACKEATHASSHEDDPQHGSIPSSKLLLLEAV